MAITMLRHSNFHGHGVRNRIVPELSMGMLLVQHCYVMVKIAPQILTEFIHYSD